MGLYARYVLPRLIDLAMQNRMVMAERQRLVPRAGGTVLEIGFGSGINLAFYGQEVRRLYAIDPSPELWKLARARAEAARVRPEFVLASAEAIPLRDAAIDDVVMTWSLCSIPDPQRALAEISRVLKPGGRLLFVEHGRSPDARVRRWQDRLTPLWKRLAGGCHLNRPIEDLVTGARFRLREIDRGYSEGPRPFTYLSRGIAQRET